MPNVLKSPVKAQMKRVNISDFFSYLFLITIHYQEIIRVDLCSMIGLKIVVSGRRELHPTARNPVEWNEDKFRALAPGFLYFDRQRVTFLFKIKPAISYRALFCQDDRASVPYEPAAVEFIK